MALMTLEQARRELRSPRQPGAEGFVRNATAAAVIYMNDQMKRGLMTRDSSGSSMRDLPRTQDQLRYPSFENSREWLNEQSRGVKLDESWATIVGPEARNPGKQVGADLVQDLPGDASSYFIAINPRTQKAALYRYQQPEADAGLVGRSNGTTAKTLDRSHYRRIAHSMDLLRETTGSVLKEMNRQNREAWSKR